MNNDENKKENQNRLVLRAYNKKELAELYEISPGTFRTWLSEYDEMFGNKFKKVLNAREVEFIFKTFGIPQKMAA